MLDRASLLARACECYVVVQAHIERLLGGSEKRSLDKKGTCCAQPRLMKKASFP